MLPIRNFVFALLILFCPARGIAETKKVGVVLPLTGPMADVGHMLQNTVRMIGDEVKGEVEFIVEDDGFLARNTVAAVRKLVEIDKISGLLVFGSGGSLAVADVAERRGIPMIAIAYSDKVTAGRTNVFRLFTTLEDSVDAVCVEARRRDYKRVALLGTANEAMTATRLAVATNCGLNVVFSDEAAAGESDFRALVLNVRGSVPDAVFFATLPPHASLLSRQLRGAGFAGEFFSTVSAAHRSEIKASQGALIGAWVASAGVARASSFLSLYASRFGELEAPEGIFTYDAVRLMLGALRGKGAATLREAKEFQGIAGDYVLDENRSFRVPVHIFGVWEQWLEPLSQ